MGTRHLVKVISGGKVVVAQYGQYDGYLECAGEEIIKNLQRPNGIESLKKSLKACSFGKYNGRNTDDGYKIIKTLIDHEGGPISLENCIGFENDMIFCEYVYEIDMDKERLIAKGLDRETLIDVSFEDLAKWGKGKEIYGE